MSTPSSTESQTALATLSAAATRLREKRRMVSALLVGVDGSAPIPAGARMVIDERGAIEGSLTGGCVEAALVEEAEFILAGGPPKLVTYGVSEDDLGDVGLMCGGTVHIFLHEVRGADAQTELAVLEAVLAHRHAAVATLLDGPHAGAKLALVDGLPLGTLGEITQLDRNVLRELDGLLDQGITAVRTFDTDGTTAGQDLRVHLQSFASTPRMIIVGAVDFSAALAPLARELGYDVTICDARERFARSPRFSRAAKVVVGWPQDVLRGQDLGPRDAVLVFTHDPKFDEPALAAALATSAGYIGALGSRKTAADRRHRLQQAGLSSAQLSRIHAPCGLDIGSRTVHETAISVLAEIIASRNHRPGAPLGATSGTIHADVLGFPQQLAA
ncbi:XdhC family protein [Streptomyces sp. NBC_00258]|uniref:XdhC family protein n=1 Tax=Streptomyces sp. NBC_00258 TaxID=2903642 RepID=UPI002E2E800F|nr:XdhC family protein [Streptomyces sp. NBC_00258]